MIRVLVILGALAALSVLGAAIYVEHLAKQSETRKKNWRLRE